MISAPTLPLPLATTDFLSVCLGWPVLDIPTSRSQSFSGFSHFMYNVWDQESGVSEAMWSDNIALHSHVTVCVLVYCLLDIWSFPFLNSRGIRDVVTLTSALKSLCWHLFSVPLDRVRRRASHWHQISKCEVGRTALAFPQWQHPFAFIDRVWSECGVFTSLPTLAIVHLMPLATLMELKYFPLDFVFSPLMSKDRYVLFLRVHAGALYPASAVCTGLTGRSHIQMLTVIGQLQELMWLVLGYQARWNAKEESFSFHCSSVKSRSPESSMVCWDLLVVHGGQSSSGWHSLAAHRQEL